MTGFTNQEGRRLVEAMVVAIQENAALLSDLDGVIGDGDHGVNMNKGFSLAAHRLAGQDWDLTQGLEVLGTVLLEEIGGAMGPLYGSFFGELATSSRGCQVIDAAVFSTMLNAGLSSIESLGGAKVGDKTLVDTLVPAIRAFDAVAQDGILATEGTFAQALVGLMDAAEQGKESTRALVARIGRASRLGERSRGVLDAGSVSCWLLLRAMAQASLSLLENKTEDQTKVNHVV